MSVQVASGSFAKFGDPAKGYRDETVSLQYARFCPRDAWQPALNLYEGPSAYYVCVDLAGMVLSDFNVQIQDNTLIIRGKRPPPVPSEIPAGDLQVHLMEIDNGSFCREVEILSPVRGEGISAGYHDGLLWLTVPKA